MSDPILGVIGIAFLVALMLLGLPMAISFAIVGTIGLMMIQGAPQGLSFLGQAFFSWTSSYTLATIPLFVLMGQLAFYSGISEELFSAAYKWVGKISGGMAVASVIACTGFAACTGSSVAAAATMSTIAYPEMQKYNYSKRISTGSIAVGGTLGILIPPSTIFIIYGIVTETSIGDLFIAGIFPGIMLGTMLVVLTYVMCKIQPSLGPPSTQEFSWQARFNALKGIWGMGILFLLVIGGLYFGVFAPSEAASVGAFAAFLITMIKRKGKMSGVASALKDTAKITAFTFFALIGAMIFNAFLTITNLPQNLAQWVTGFDLSPILILIVICIFYIPLGCIVEGMAMILLTVPIVFPIITTLGFDPVWFGVLICVLTELSLVTPPVGINLYVVQGITKVPINDIIIGMTPYASVLIIGVALLIAFPQISLFLPHTMK